MRSRVARAARENHEIWTEMTSYSCIYDLSITYVHSLKPAIIITGFAAGDDNHHLPHSSSALVVCWIPLQYGILASLIFLDFSEGVGTFAIGLSQISSFFYYKRDVY